MRFYKLAFSMLEVLIALVLFALVLLVSAKKTVLMLQYTQSLFQELQANLLLDSSLQCQLAKVSCPPLPQSFRFLKLSESEVIISWEYLEVMHSLRRSI